MASEEGAVRPSFKPLSGGGGAGDVVSEETRTIRVPSHRYSPLKESWEEIVRPIIDHMKLMIRMNTKSRSVEIKTSAFTTDIGALQKAEDFVKAFILGFEVRDAIALLRMEDLYVETFEVTDVKPLKGDHLSRAIGRIAGQVRCLPSLGHTLHAPLTFSPATPPHPLKCFRFLRVGKQNMPLKMPLECASLWPIVKFTFWGPFLT